MSERGLNWDKIGPVPFLSLSRGDCDVFWSVPQQVSRQTCISQTSSCWVMLPSLCIHVHVFVCLMANERRIPQSWQRWRRQPLVIILWEAVPDVGTATCNAYTLSRHSVGFSSHLSALSDVNACTTHTHAVCVPGGILKSFSLNLRDSLVLINVRRSWSPWREEWKTRKETDMRERY